MKFSECGKYIHNGCLRLSKNIQNLHCHSIFCKPRMQTNNMVRDNKQSFEYFHKMRLNDI